jgi:hypothetical protein
MRILLFLSLILFSGVSQATNMELTFHLGPSLFQTGDIEELGSPQINTSFQFDYFATDNHGIGASWGNEFDFDGSGKLSAVMEDNSVHTFDIHYAYRKMLGSSNFRLSFNPGIGWQTLYDQAWDYYWGYTYYDAVSSAFILNYKLMVDYVVKDWNNEQQFFVGTGITQVFSFNDEYRGQDISGSRMSMLFRAGFGF